MITASAGKRQPTEARGDWKRQLADGYRDAGALLRDLGLEEKDVALSRQADTLFATRVPRSYANRMEYGNPDDPLLRQVLPVAEETRETPGFVSDPVGDLDSVMGTGILKKYQGRALLITTGACAVHCRYCFRRHFPYSDESAARNRWQDTLDSINNDPSLHEVILSGGDPLSLDNPKLQPLIDGLDGISHVKRLRIHTRLPVVIPDRVNEGLLKLIQGYNGAVTVVIHANHARELDATVADALNRLRQTGALLLNQAVLLKGVNDSSQAQHELGEKLTAAGVAPYYLHQLDPVAGAAHFQVTDRQAQALIEALRIQAPGYMVPRLVREIAGEESKTPLSPTAILEIRD